jgi:hypothetical protein
MSLRGVCHDHASVFSPRAQILADTTLDSATNHGVVACRRHTNPTRLTPRLRNRMKRRDNSLLRFTADANLSGDTTNISDLGVAMQNFSCMTGSASILF